MEVLDTRPAFARARAAARSIAARGGVAAPKPGSAVIAAAKTAVAILAAHKQAPGAAPPTAALGAGATQPAVAAQIEAARAAAAAFAKTMPSEAQAAREAGGAGGPSADAGTNSGPTEAILAARVAAQRLAQQMSAGAAGSSAPSAEPSSSSNEAGAKRAAAAFAESLKKKPRWGDGATALTTKESEGPSASKTKQALAVAQLKDKLVAFRKDRGTEVNDGPKKSLKLYIPPPPEGREPKNWVGILIGREGINRKRLQQSTGATLSLRGRGTGLRGQTKLADQVDKRGRLTDAGEAMEEMHVVLEADTDDQLEAARVQVMMIIDPPDKSSALTLFDEATLERTAEEKTLKTEECAFCGKPGHHHSKCPKRRTAFSMSGVFCTACGSGGHTARDCKGDRSGVVKNHTAGLNKPSVFEDDDFAAFQAELAWRS